MKRLLATLVLVVTALVAGRAEARDDGINSPRRRAYRGEVVTSDPKAQRWYGWQVLAVDFASFAALGAGATTEQGVPAVAGVATYFIGAPIVHLGNGEPWRAGTSLGIRLSAPILAVGLFEATGWSASCAEYDADCREHPEMLFLSLGVFSLAASMVDALAFSYRSEPSPTPARSLSWMPTLALVPTTERRFTASAGLVGIF